jgi:hypothetical protein
MPLDIRYDYRRRGSERRRPDETGGVIEHPCARDAIGVAPFDRDPDFDDAVRADDNAGIRQVDLVRLYGNRAAEERGQHH